MSHYRQLENQVRLPGGTLGSVQWARCSEPAAFPSPSQVGTRDIRVAREAPAGALWSHEASGVSRAVVHCVDSKSDRFVRSWHDGRYRGRRTRLPPQCAGRARAMVPQPRRYHGSVKLGRRRLTAAKLVPAPCCDRGPGPGLDLGPDGGNLSGTRQVKQGPLTGSERPLPGLTVRSVTASPRRRAPPADRRSLP